jgi:NADP-dependent 3-hydroxy acid dehydrogenase YdfG
VDVLINNAGAIGPAGPTWELDPAAWWRTFEVNLGGTVALTSIVLPDMIAAGHGRILNITSNAGATDGRCDPPTRPRRRRWPS